MTIPARAQRLLVPAALLVAVFLAFGHALFQDFAPIDDTLLIRENLAIRGFTLENLRYVFTHFDPELYIPLTFVSFQVNYVLGGLDPFGFHLGNVLLHAANAFLVFLFLRKLIHQEIVAFIGAMIFAAHPLHTEAVVWIAGRKDLLFTFFYLLTLVLYVRGKEGSNRSVWYWASVLCGLLAFLSKATAMTLPVVLLLLDWFEGAAARLSFDTSTSLRAGSAQGDMHWRRALLTKIPFFLLSVLFAVIALGGKERIVGFTSMLDTALVAVRSFGHYLWQFFIPMGFSVFYQQRDPIVDAYFFLSFISLLSLISLSWYFRNRKPWIAFGVLFYLITLSPTFFNFHKGLISFYAVDRYAYLPSIGVIFIFVIALKELLAKIPKIKNQTIFNFQFSIFNSVLVALLILTLVFLSRHQVKVWDTPVSLYSRAVTVDPASVPARSALAQVLRQLGSPAAAFNLLKEGLQYGDDVSYHLEAGNIYAANGQIGDAIVEFTKVSQMKPDLPDPIFSIGNLEEHRGNADVALEYYRKALALDPSYVGARVRIADILIDRGLLEEAEQQLVEAMRWNESFFGANVQMSRLREVQGRGRDAEVYRTRAKALRPGEPLDY